MPPDIKAEIKGLRETQKEMERIVRELHGPPMLQAVRDSALLIQRDARKNAPVDTARLRASIVPSVTARGNEVRGVVGSNVVYAPFQELGTGTFVGKQAHFPPPSALERWAGRKGMNAFVVARSIWRRGGLRAKKFLENAFKSNEARIRRMIEAAVGRIVK